MPDIEITFSGLCLFVPVGDGSSRRMTVLLPQTPLPSEAVPSHKAMLSYLGGPKELNAKQVSFPTGTPSVPAGLHKGVVDISATHGNNPKVLPSELGSSPTALRGRVVLTAGKFDRHGDLKKWKVGTTGQCAMTDAAVWRINNVSTGDLVMRISDFAGGNVENIPLHVDPDGVAKVTLTHHCSCSYPVVCPWHSPHFGAYHKLLANGGSLPLPQLEPEDCPPTPPLHVHPDEHGKYHPSTEEDVDEAETSIYTCMVAGAQPGP